MDGWHGCNGWMANNRLRLYNGIKSTDKTKAVTLGFLAVIVIGSETKKSLGWYLGRLYFS